MSILDTIQLLNEHPLAEADLEPPKPPRKSKPKCEHPTFHYEKWVHNGKAQGKSFHYKEVCDLCGRRRCVPRTKELFELLKTVQWHHKAKKNHAVDN